jgi:hypothetical protein
MRNCIPSWQRCSCNTVDTKIKYSVTVHLFLGLESHFDYTTWGTETYWKSDWHYHCQKVWSWEQAWIGWHMCSIHTFDAVNNAPKYTLLLSPVNLFLLRDTNIHTISALIYHAGNMYAGAMPNWEAYMRIRDVRVSVLYILVHTVFYLLVLGTNTFLQNGNK